VGGVGGVGGVEGVGGDSELFGSPRSPSHLTT
jgi:hypothetical protein